jgi:hypothetical protein
MAKTTDSNDADYAEYGGLVSVPGPFHCSDVTIFAFALKADPEKLADLCRTVLVDPQRKRQYRPVGSVVLLTFGSMIVRSKSSAHSNFFGISYDAMGQSAEKHAALWLLTQAEHRRDRVELIDQLVAFTPGMWVDNPVSLLGGREIYGFAKQWGSPAYSTDGPPNCTLDVFGGNFGETQTTGMKRLFELTPRTGGSALAAIEEGTRELIQTTDQELRKLMLGDVEVPSMSLLRHLANDLIHKEISQVCRRQFRSHDDDGSHPSPQELIEVTTQCHQIQAHLIPHRFDFTLHHVDSHPLQASLGIESQTVELGLHIEADFSLGAS